MGDGRGLKCPLCLEEFGDGRNPKVFDCGHSICDICVGDFWIASGTTDYGSVCPICRLPLESRGKKPEGCGLICATNFGIVEAQTVIHDLEDSLDQAQLQNFFREGTTNAQISILRERTARLLNENEDLKKANEMLSHENTQLHARLSNIYHMCEKTLASTSKDGEKEADAVGDGHSVDTESLAGFLSEVRRLNTYVAEPEKVEETLEGQESDAQPSYSEASLQPASEPSSGTEESKENGNSKSMSQSAGKRQSKGASQEIPEKIGRMNLDVSLGSQSSQQIGDDTADLDQSLDYEQDRGRRRRSAGNRSFSPSSSASSPAAIRKRASRAGTSMRGRLSQTPSNVRSRQRYERKKRQSLPTALQGDEAAFAERVSNVKEHHCGTLGAYVCAYCGALHYTGEKGAKCKFCGDGRIYRPPMRPPPRRLLRRYYFKKAGGAGAFRNKLNAYNTAFSFASRRMHIQQIKGQGIPVPKVKGTVWHHLSSVMPTPGRKPIFGSCYAYNAEDAAEMRKDNTTIGEGLNSGVCESFVRDVAVDVERVERLLPRRE